MISPTTFSAIQHGIIFILALSFGIFILLKDRKSSINRSFFILASAVAFWQFSDFFVACVDTLHVALVWVKVAYAGVVLIPSATYHFTTALLHLNRKPRVRLFYVLSFIYAAIILHTNYVIIGVRRLPWGYYPEVRFDVHTIFLVVWIVPFVWSIVHLYQSYKQADSPSEKRRIKYFLIMLPIAYTSIIDFAPNYGLAIPPLGLIPIMVFIILTAYGIIRYRLFDIAVVFKKITLYTAGFVVSVICVYVASFVFQSRLMEMIGKNWLIVPIAVSFFIGIAAFWFIDVVRHMEEHELSQKFAYRPLLKKEAERLSSVRSLRELLSYVTRDVSGWMHLDYFGICVWDIHTKGFILAKNVTRSEARDPLPVGLVLSEGDPLIQRLRINKKALIASEMQFYLNDKSILVEEREFLLAVLEQMRRLGAEIVVPSMCQDRLLAFLTIGNKCDPRDIITTGDIEILSSLANQIARTIEGFLLREEKIQLIVASQKLLISAIEAKDAYTRGHTDRVAYYSTLLGRLLEKQLRSYQVNISDLNWAALLHDVGKISIPDAVLLKPGPLEKEERQLLEMHAKNSMTIIGPMSEWLGDDICRGVVQHHENWDGSGYPDGLCGEEIHLFGRIIRVADSFDAMTSNRPYRTALPHPQAMVELKRYAGTYYDVEVVEAMEELYHDGRLELEDNLL